MNRVLDLLSGLSAKVSGATPNFNTGRPEGMAEAKNTNATRKGTAGGTVSLSGGVSINVSEGYPASSSGVVAIDHKVKARTEDERR